jgi:hypothetical protein
MGIPHPLHAIVVIGKIHDALTIFKALTLFGFMDRKLG